MLVDSNTMINLLLMVILFTWLINLLFRKASTSIHEGFLVNDDNYKFDNFDYWWKTPALLSPTHHPMHGFLPTNTRLF